MTPRCIALVGGQRCPHVAALMPCGDLYCCTRHDSIHLAILDDRLAPATRKMLAYSKWISAAEGQRLINKMYRRRAA